MKKEKYTIRTLFLPRLKGRPIREILAIFMLNPIVWLIEGSVWFLFGILAIYQAKEVAPHAAVLVLIVAAIAITAFSIFYLLLIWLLDFFEREPLRFIIALFMWGVASTLGSLIFNELLGLFLSILGPVAAQIGTTVIVAPIVEEFMKGIGLIIIAGHHEMDDTMDGIVYGFSVGIGFAAVENLLYFSAAFQEGYTSTFDFLSFVLYRSVLCMIGHGCFTATTGMFMGFMKGRGKWSKYSQLFGFIGMIFAMGLHGLFNATAVVQSVFLGIARINKPVPIFHGPLVFAMATVYAIIIAFALWESYARVHREKEYEIKRKSSLLNEPEFTKEEAMKQDIKFCHKCNVELPYDASFCGKCGHRF